MVYNLLKLNETHFASAEYSSKIFIWELKKNEPIRILQDKGPTRYWNLKNISKFVFASSSIGDEISIKLWNWVKGVCVRTLQGHT